METSSNDVFPLGTVFFEKQEVLIRYVKSVTEVGIVSRVDKLVRYRPLLKKLQLVTRVEKHLMAYTHDKCPYSTELFQWL